MCSPALRPPLHPSSSDLQRAAVPTRALHHVPEGLLELEAIVAHQRDAETFQAGGLAALALVALTPHVVFPRWKVNQGQEIRLQRVRGKVIDFSPEPKEEEEEKEEQVRGREKH